MAEWQPKKKWQTTYSLSEASDFLDISESRMQELTDQDMVRVYSYSGKRYYLGGELDILKHSLHQDSVAAFNEPLPCLPPISLASCAKEVVCDG